MRDATVQPTVVDLVLDWISKQRGRRGPGDGGMDMLSSAVAFVDGGVYAYDHTCNICLKAFCDSDSSTVAASILQM